MPGERKVFRCRFIAWPCSLEQLFFFFCASFVLGRVPRVSSDGDGLCLRGFGCGHWETGMDDANVGDTRRRPALNTEYLSLRWHQTHGIIDVCLVCLVCLVRKLINTAQPRSHLPTCRSLPPTRLLQCKYKTLTLRFVLTDRLLLSISHACLNRPCYKQSRLSNTASTHTASVVTSRIGTT